MKWITLCLVSILLIAITITNTNAAPEADTPGNQNEKNSQVKTENHAQHSNQISNFLSGIKHSICDRITNGANLVRTGIKRYTSRVGSFYNNKNKETNEIKPEDNVKT
ncbi:uncharacterized protein LOC126895546 [Daktulosphaira vitifoliae]|uniref:uncharacterized protein LOC126895546 n=1 Tax=Daktulosphaira vitifoliae TaxID=58002 RepID=UPI0021AACF72|nr:uncharacterized protein LOC126895546 [Daktulosphaira vitifoliae]XP_050523489.1 uncharacterized protein LOC126895546 [Daktulosphaira vitifoliae]XP_050523490.1 uncharacterized protein LOC126895546 [Daktulosphaira vitifoliae]XP_050523491.1 uncharacterized protein LOC126895546 [Daktulosphaira vitifoliae]